MKKNKEDLTEEEQVQNLAKKFGGFTDPEKTLARLKEMVSKIKTDEKFKLNAAEMAYIAKHIGGSIIKSSQGDYYIAAKDVMIKYIEHINSESLSLVSFVKELNEIQAILAMPTRKNGQVVVDAQVYMHKARNGLLHTDGGNDIFEVTLLDNVGIYDADIVVKTVGNDEFNTEVLLQRRRV